MKKLMEFCWGLVSSKKAVYGYGTAVGAMTIIALAVIAAKLTTPGEIVMDTVESIILSQRYSAENYYIVDGNLYKVTITKTPGYTLNHKLK